MYIKKFLRLLKYILIAYGICILVFNWSTLGGLITYINSYFNHEYASPSPVNKNGNYKTLYDLTTLNSAERSMYIKDHLDSIGLNYQEFELGAGQSNILAVGDTSQAISIITAHYDILDRPDYQGALDNSASISILLHLCQTQKFQQTPIGILFTGMEEQGLYGSRIFVEETIPEIKLKVKNAICLDGVGRGQLSVMNNGSKFGVVFRDHFFRKTLFDGKYLTQPDYFFYRHYPTNVLDLKKNNIHELSAFVSSTDAWRFSLQNIPTVHLISDDLFHFTKFLHTSADKTETVDQRALENCEQVLIRFIEAAKQKSE